MVRVGVLGMGFIGQQHYQTWQEVEGAEVVAVADQVSEKVAESAMPVGGNIGDADPLDLSAIGRYTSLEDMLSGTEVDVVDACLPTFVHAPLVKAAFAAGKHVICEKPMALDTAACDEMIAAADEAGKMLFLAHCIRFWPEYEVLAGMLESGELGRLISLSMKRVSPSPFWSHENWLNDAELSGGALLDLHIHDADFAMSILGMPPAVSSRCGDVATDGPEVNHVVTQYLYDDAVVVAEGGWAMPPDFPFEMAFTALGEKGCLTFSTSHDPMLTWYPMEGGSCTPEYRATTGYAQELEYFTKCIAEGTPPKRVTGFDAREAVRLVAAERESAETGGVVTL